MIAEGARQSHVSFPTIYPLHAKGALAVYSLFNFTETRNSFLGEEAFSKLVPIRPALKDSIRAALTDSIRAPVKLGEVLRLRACFDN